MAKQKGTVADVFSHWCFLFEDLQESPQTFYAAVEQAVKARAVPDMKISRVMWKEGGIMSAKREYLRVTRREYVFDICGAPFGKGFFVSWWLGEPAGCVATLSRLPYVGPFLQVLLRPVTYFQIDTATMFQSLTHGAVMEVVDQMTETRGVQALSESERKPVMRDFYRR